MYDLSFIIPVYNNSNFTKMALNGLSKLSNKYEIVVVDNNSSDNTPEMMEEFLNNQNPDKAKIIYVRMPQNVFFGKANNKGYKHSKGENVCFINNDIRVDADFETWPEKMIQLSKDGYIVGTQGGLLDSSFNFIKEERGMPQTDYWYLSGWCVCASRKTFDKLIMNHYIDLDGVEHEGKDWGPWNGRFDLYYEDVDLTWRAKEMNIPIMETPIPVHHYSRVTGKKYNMMFLLKKSKKILLKYWRNK